MVGTTCMHFHVAISYIRKLLKQGIALTGRNTTGPPNAAPASYVAYASVTEDRRRQTPETVTSLAPCTMCRWASNKHGRMTANTNHQ